MGSGQILWHSHDERKRCSCHVFSTCRKNIVAVELVRRGYTVGVGMLGEREVDFVAERGRERMYVQVSYLMPTAAIRDREFSVLERIRDNYPKCVLSMDELDFSRNGIIHRPIREFLLD